MQCLLQIRWIKTWVTLCLCLGVTSPIVTAHDAVDTLSLMISLGLDVQGTYIVETPPFTVSGLSKQFITQHGQWLVLDAKGDTCVVKTNLSAQIRIAHPARVVQRPQDIQGALTLASLVTPDISFLTGCSMMLHNQNDDTLLIINHGDSSGTLICDTRAIPIQVVALDSIRFSKQAASMLLGLCNSQEPVTIVILNHRSMLFAQGNTSLLIDGLGKQHARLYRVAAFEELRALFAANKAYEEAVFIGSAVFDNTQYQRMLLLLTASRERWQETMRVSPKILLLQNKES